MPSKETGKSSFTERNKRKKGAMMKLRYLKTAQLVLGLLVIGAPALKTLTRTGVQVSVWFYIFEALCIAGLYVCHRLYRCPHCKRQLKITHEKECPHCKEPLDV